MRNLVFIEKYDKYGIILKSRKVKTIDGKDKVIRRINFDNDLELLKKPELLLQKSFYDENYDPLIFRIATIKCEDGYNDIISYYCYTDDDVDLFITIDEIFEPESEGLSFVEITNYDDALKIAKRIKRRREYNGIYIAAFAGNSNPELFKV